MDRDLSLAIDKGDNLEVTLKDKHRLQQTSLKTDEFLSKIEQLSPQTQRRMKLVLNYVVEKKAHLEEDAKGTVKLTYKDEKTIPRLYYVDKSEADVIQQPKSDEDITRRIKSMMELIEYEKENRSPAGVVLDSSKITLKNRKYRKGEQFRQLGEILGKGNIAGDIIVVEDVGSKTKHAVKSVMISQFRENEVKCWVDLNETEFVPKLYLIRREENEICFHMEELKQAITLKDILEESVIPADCCRPFSLYVFKGLLSAVRRMHEKNWSHGDLHAGNVMFQKPLDIKVIDFGKANEIASRQTGVDFAGKDDDILQTIRLFSALYTGQMFDSATDLKKNYKEKLAEISNILKLSYDDRVELFQLVDITLSVTHRSGDDLIYDTQSHLNKIDDIITKVEEKLKQENVDEICKKVAAILFKEEEYVDLHCDLGSEDSDEDFVDSPETLESRAAQVPDDFIRGLRKRFSIKLREDNI